MSSPAFEFEKGFSVIEVVVVISILATILTIGVISFGNVNSDSKLDSASNQIISLLSEARLRSIHSDTDGQPLPSSFGVHFDTDQAVLFRGSSYNSTDTTNFKIAMDQVTISPNLPCPSAPTNCQNQLFARLSGEVSNFSQSTNSLCLTSSGKSAKLTINYLGVVDVQQNGC